MKDNFPLCRHSEKYLQTNWNKKSTYFFSIFPPFIIFLSCISSLHQNDNSNISYVSYKGYPVNNFLPLTVTGFHITIWKICSCRALLWIHCKHSFSCTVKWWWEEVWDDACAAIRSTGRACTYAPVSAWISMSGDEGWRAVATGESTWGVAWVLGKLLP